MKYYLGLGSNLGQREKNLTQALTRLQNQGISIKRISSVYETQPYGDTNQPWYMNIAVEIHTDLSPLQLLEKIKKIEKKMGRTLHGMNNPRPIDIDILMLENKVVKNDRLQIPHQELANRNFVLVPLMEIAPNVVHPVLQSKLKEIYRNCKDESIVRKIKGPISL